MGPTVMMQRYSSFNQNHFMNRSGDHYGSSWASGQRCTALSDATWICRHGVGMRIGLSRIPVLAPFMEVRELPHATVAWHKVTAYAHENMRYCNTAQYCHGGDKKHMLMINSSQLKRELHLRNLTNCRPFPTTDLEH
eukprot:scpid44206/ scgid13324/ 